MIKKTGTVIITEEGIEIKDFRLGLPTSSNEVLKWAIYQLNLKLKT